MQWNNFCLCFQLSEPGTSANLTAYVMDLMELNQKIMAISYQNTNMNILSGRLFDGTIWQAIIQNYTSEVLRPEWITK